MAVHPTLDRAKFLAIAACTKTGKPNYEQLRMNGMPLQFLEGLRGS